jgi:hypothetical protein
MLALPIYAMQPTSDLAYRLAPIPQQMNIGVFSIGKKDSTVISIPLGQAPEYGIPKTLIDIINTVCKDTKGDNIVRHTPDWQLTVCLANGIGCPILLDDSKESPTYSPYGIYVPKNAHHYQLVRKLFLDKIVELCPATKATTKDNKEAQTLPVTQPAESLDTPMQLDQPRASSPLTNLPR